MQFNFEKGQKVKLKNYSENLFHNGEIATITGGFYFHIKTFYDTENNLPVAHFGGVEVLWEIIWENGNKNYIPENNLILLKLSKKSEIFGIAKWCNEHYKKE